MVAPAGDAQPSKQQNEAHLARKRRRKNPSTGAADDCFSCMKRGTKCDRRRPYCSQCLDLGKECSGYRTTLTWGVGVASRGKLRGRTLPIANEPNKKAQAQSKNVSKADSSKAAPSASPTLPRSAGDNIGQPLPRSPTNVASVAPNAFSPHVTSTHTAPSTYFANSSAPSHSNSSQRYPDGSFPPTSYAPMSVPPYPSSFHPYSRDSFAPVYHNQTQYPHSMDRLQQNYQPRHFGSQREESAWSPRSTLSNTSYGTASHSESSYEASNFPHTPEQFDQSDPPVLEQDSRSNPPYQPPEPQIYEPRSHPSAYGSHDWGNKSQPFAESLAQADGKYHFVGQSYRPSQHDFMSEEEGPQIITDDGHDPFEGLEVVKSSDQQGKFMDFIPMPVWESPFFHLPPRMRYLLDYYDKMICSVLVAFDGDDNPYRQHVLSLAGHNPALQTAIAALVTNNLRMRNLKEVSLLKSQSDAQQEQDALQSVLTVIGKPSMEEQHYKAKSIQLLNAQLASAVSAKDDSVLATLLILCLFHVSDSGFSKFKTQLAGVQKLLRMRGQTGSQSNFVGWVEMFFAWFDAMTSAVNDRETQIQNPAILDLRHNLGALEQFSGCDGRLFKLIARLGRLNLLSQRRPVRDLSDLSPSGYGKSGMDASQPIRMFDDFRATGFDASGLPGFGGIPMFDTDDFAENPPDDRHQFWQEWTDIRKRLKNWVTDPTCPNEDLVHISESFRYSALLYTERLAHPATPSSNMNFQGLVSQSMAHISRIGVSSCVLKFMLWPLFITGTECVQELHKNIIRDRCVEIQKESGFYNNLSSLEVLEKVWREGQNKGAQEEMMTHEAFRWRRAMDRVDGEYIVI